MGNGAEGSPRHVHFGFDRDVLEILFLAGAVLVCTSILTLVIWLAARRAVVSRPLRQRETSPQGHALIDEASGEEAAAASALDGAKRDEGADAAISDTQESTAAPRSHGESEAGPAGYTRA